MFYQSNEQQPTEPVHDAELSLSLQRMLFASKRIRGLTELHLQAHLRVEWLY